MDQDPAVDAYLAGLGVAHRVLLAAVRAELHVLVPDGEELVSYGMPGVRVGGTTLLWFAGWTRHCALYPVDAGFKAAHADALAGLAGSKDSVHFSPARPLPPGLLAALVEHRRGRAGGT